MSEVDDSSPVLLESVIDDGADAVASSSSSSFSPQPISASPSSRPTAMGGAAMSRSSIPQNGQLDASALTCRPQRPQGANMPAIVTRSANERAFVDQWGF